MDFPKITSAFLNLTNTCNLGCKYCFVHQNPQKISLQVAIDAADWLAANCEQGQRPFINFFGGEPLLMYGEIIKPLIKYIRDKYQENFDLGITSNCTLMTEDVAEFLSENKVGLLLSMDGDKYSQDVNRPLKDGGSSFEILYPKLQMIRKYWPEVTFRSTITPITAPYLFENIIFAEKMGFINYFAMPNCFEPWSDNDINVLRTEIEKYTNHYIKSFQQDKNPIIFGDIEKMFRVIIERNKAIENNIYREESFCKSCGKCGLGASCSAGINFNGDIVSCQELFSCQDAIFVIGNIYDGINNEKRESLCKWWDSKDFYGKDCPNCKLNRVCSGYCAINNYLSGDMHKVPSILCDWKQIEFENAVKIAITLGEEKNKRFKERWGMYVR